MVLQVSGKFEAAFEKRKNVKSSGGRFLILLQFLSDVIHVSCVPEYLLFEQWHQKNGVRFAQRKPSAKTSFGLRMAFFHQTKNAEKTQRMASEPMVLLQEWGEIPL